MCKSVLEKCSSVVMYRDTYGVVTYVIRFSRRPVQGGRESGNGNGMDVRGGYSWVADEEDRGEVT